MNLSWLSIFLFIGAALLLMVLFFAPWLAADPGAYVPPWLQSILGVADAASGNVVTDILGGLMEMFGGGSGGGGGLPIDLKGLDALRSVVNVLQSDGKFTAWSLFHHSFISMWIKTSLILVAATGIVSLIGGGLALLGGDELAQVAGWLGAIIGVLAAALQVITMPALLRLGAANDIGMAIITAVFNVHLGYGFWAGLLLVILLTALNLLLAVSPPVSRSRRRPPRPQSRTITRYR